MVPRDGVLDVVIDTDLTNEIDDEFALVQAILSPDRLNILAIHAAPYSLSQELVESGALTELGIRLLKEDLEAIGLDLSATPVVEPADAVEDAYAMAEQIATLMNFTPPNGIHRGSDRFLADRETPVESDAASNLIELAMEPRDTPLIVVANGAITNVASALIQEPAIAEKMIVVWTAAYPSFWPHANNSFNLVQDVDAARVVFESGTPVVYIPGYFVGEKLRVTLPEMVEYIQGKGAVGDFLYALYEDFPLFGGHYAKSKVLWDMVTIGYLLDPASFDEREVDAMTLDEERRWVPGAGAPVIEPIDFDRDRIFRDFYEKIEAQAE
jgi:inosine-uridine nucleoside N-ribohydrolase